MSQNLELILKMWSEDCKIDGTNLEYIQLTVFELHHKYWEILAKTRLEYKKIMAKSAKLKANKTHWYIGSLSRDEMSKLGWTKFPLRVLKTEVNEYLEADDDLIQSKLEMAEYSEVMSFLEDILKTIHNRGYALKNIIDLRKMNNAGS